jgi:hypothetical protein
VRGGVDGEGEGEGGLGDGGGEDGWMGGWERLRNGFESSRFAFFDVSWGAGLEPSELVMEVIGRLSYNLTRFQTKSRSLFCIFLLRKCDVDNQ